LELSLAKLTASMERLSSCLKGCLIIVLAISGNSKHFCFVKTEEKKLPGGSSQNFRTLGQPLMGEKYVAEKLRRVCEFCIGYVQFCGGYMKEKEHQQ
jgi:hypothetical protein